jgi:hypothetical protein
MLKIVYNSEKYQKANGKDQFVSSIYRFNQIGTVDTLRDGVKKLDKFPLTTVLP